MGILSIIPSIADIGKDILDRVIPDPAQAAAAKLELAKLQQTGELGSLDSVTKLAEGQLAVDNTEAASSDPLQHWRGGAGWVCVLALGYEFLIQPIGTWITNLCGSEIVAPSINVNALMPLLIGMLGLGTMHVAEKITAIKTSGTSGAK